MAGDSEEVTKPVVETRAFIVRCVVKDAMGDLEAEFMDTVPAASGEDAKDYLAGWMADRGFTVDRWVMVGDLEQLRKVARNL